MASYAEVATSEDAIASMRLYVTDCGETLEAPTHRMSEADALPGGTRCARGCFPAEAKTKEK